MEEVPVKTGPYYFAEDTEKEEGTQGRRKRQRYEGWGRCVGLGSGGF